MELKAYLIIFKKYAFLIAAFTIIGAAVGYIFASKAPSGQRVDGLFYISAQNKNTPPQPNPDLELYSQSQNARNFTDTAVAILASPDFLNEFANGRQAVSVRKIAPQVVKVSAVSSSAVESQALLDALEQNFNQKITSLDPTSSLKIKPVGQPSPATTTKFNPKIITLFGAFVGFIFALTASGLKSYFKL